MAEIEMIFARLGMAPVSLHVRTPGPSRGCVRSQCSKRGEERAKQAAASMRKTVPGRSGRKMPATPITMKMHPVTNKSGRRTFSARRRGGDMIRIMGVRPGQARPIRIFRDFHLAGNPRKIGAPRP